MREQENLTYSFRSDYTEGMSEGGPTRLLENNTIVSSELPRWQNATHAAETLIPQKKGFDAWIENKEQEIAAIRVEKQPKIPRTLVRGKESWREFGWEDDQREKLKEMLQETLVLKSAHVENLMQILLTTGKKPEEIMQDFDRHIEDVRNSSESWQPRYTREDERTDKDILALSRLGLRNARQIDYLKKFVFTEQLRDELTRDNKRERPDNLYELAWQIIISDPEHEELFGVDGEYPILEMRVDTDADGNVTGGRYVVNQANFIRWERERIWHWQNEEPDDYVNYLEKIQFKKDLGSLSLHEILNDHSKYFADEEGEYYAGLAKEALLEPWMIAKIRELHIVYKGVMNSDKNIVENLTKLFAQNPLTKKVYGKNLWYYMMTMPLDFEGTRSDTTMGAAVNMMVLAYYNISDFDRLQQILGEDSSFFTRKGMEDAIIKVLGNRYDNTRSLSQQLGTFMGKDAFDSFQKAFGIKVKTDAEGNAVLDENDQEILEGRLDVDVDNKDAKDAFIKLINIFALITQNKNVTDVVTTALKKAVSDRLNFKSTQSTLSGEKQKIDEYSLNVAGLMAEAMTLWTGIGARNDVSAAGFDAFSKIHNLEKYRRKMATPERGNGMGNPATVAQFKMLVVDFMQAVRVSESYITKTDKDGNVISTKETKSILQVMEEMRFIEEHHHEARNSLLEELDRVGTDMEARRLAEARLAQLDKEAAYAYKQIAGQLDFKDNTMVNYTANHLARAQKMYEQVMGYKQIKFDDFVVMDPLTKSVAFNREKFQKDIQEDFLKPLRYLISTYGELNFNTPVRAAVFTGRDHDNKNKDEFEYKTVPLGEAMFGYQMLNIPEFRKREIIEYIDRKTGEKKKKEGKYIMEDGRYVIDYEKVNAKKELVWKQWALTKLATDLGAHIASHSKEKAYNAQYLFSVVEAIESIPTEVLGDEYDMNKTMVKNKFFSPEQMKWFKKLSKTTFFHLLRRALKHDRKHKEARGWGDSFAQLMNAVFRG